jgi:trimethylamine--corrinoid protein Co-methyltransferase
MNPNDISFTPTLTFLSESDKEKIYHAALKVLEKTGMQLQHEEALSLLKNAGCIVEADGWVKIPAGHVEAARKRVPNNIAIYDREGRHAMDLGGRRIYFGTGSDLMHHVSAKHMEREVTRLEHVQRAARVCDALPNIDFIMSFAHPHDIPPARAYLESFKAMAENSVKPIVNTAEGQNDLAEIWEISKILRGGEVPLREKPYWIHYAEPVSPLKHPYTSVDKLLFCARKGMPVIYSPAPIAGSTAPITIAGHVVQGLAESFFGMVVHQLAEGGAPFIMGMGPAVLDMATTQCSYNAPEYLMAYMAMVEMSHYFDIPNWGYAGTSDAQVPDGQAIFEGGLLTFMSATAGSNLNHDVGYLNFGLTGSLEMIVIMDEIIDQIRRIQKGIPITHEQIAIDTIVEGYQKGHFLDLSHTFAHYRQTQWRPKLFSRWGHERWVEDGKTHLIDRAAQRLDEILASHQPEPIPAKLTKAIEHRLADFSPVTQ